MWMLVYGLLWNYFMIISDHLSNNVRGLPLQKLPVAPTAPNLIGSNLRRSAFTAHSRLATLPSAVIASSQNSLSSTSLPGIDSVQSSQASSSLCRQANIGGFSSTCSTWLTHRMKVRFCVKSKWQKFHFFWKLWEVS